MNLITTLGGTVGILLGALIMGLVVVVGLLPFLFMVRPHELKEPMDERHEGRARMSLHT